MDNVIVELPTAAGWVRPVNEVLLRIGAGVYTRELLAAVPEIPRPGKA